MSPTEIDKLQPEKRKETLSGLQTFLSLVPRWYSPEILNLIDDFKSTVPCKFTVAIKDRNVLRHTNFQMIQV